MSLVRFCFLIFRLLPVLGFYLQLQIAAAQAPAGNEIVLLTDRPPHRSGEVHPSARELIETWLAGYGWDNHKRFDQEQYEIIDKRVTRNDKGRAFLQFRVLPLKGDAMSLAAKRCPGRGKPIEMQIYYQWNNNLKLWTALDNRGDPGFKACSKDELWTVEQIDKIVAPPPLPPIAPVALKDVVSPARGSPERGAVLDALRPSFERTFGSPIQFGVDTLRIAGNFAWVIVHPQRPQGRLISEKDWKAGVGNCEQSPASAAGQFWMRKRGGEWQIAWENSVCATDSISDIGYLIGAPPQLVGMDAWPDTDFMPVNDPQYFKLWWP
jgi:hypothetical protein